MNSSLPKRKMISTHYFIEKEHILCLLHFSQEVWQLLLLPRTTFSIQLIPLCQLTHSSSLGREACSNLILGLFEILHIQWPKGNNSFLWNFFLFCFLTIFILFLCFLSIFVLFLSSFLFLILLSNINSI